MNKKYSYKELILVIIIIIIFTLIFNSKAYLNWATGLKANIFRQIFLNIFKPIDNFAEILYLDSIYKNNRKIFLGILNKPVKNVEKNLDPVEKEEDYYSIKKPLKIIMLGDSMIKEAISMAFLKLNKNKEELNITVSAFYSSGLARIDVFDWLEQLEKDFSNGYDVAIVMIGMNDGQDIIDNDKRVVLFTDEWQRIYKERLNRFLTKIDKNVKKIIWIGLPFMRDRGYNERMIKLNNIIKEECSNFENIFFLDPNKILYNNEEYKEYIKIKDKLIQVRIYDGKHFTKEGASLIMEDAIKIIYNNFKFESILDIKRDKLIDIKDF